MIRRRVADPVRRRRHDDDGVPLTPTSFRDPAIVHREGLPEAESTSHWYAVVFVDANGEPHEITTGDLRTARLVYAALAGLDTALPAL